MGLKRTKHHILASLMILSIFGFSFMASADEKFVPVCNRSALIVLELQLYLGKPCEEINELDLKSVSEVTIFKDGLLGEGLVIRKSDFRGMTNLERVLCQGCRIQRIEKGTFSNMPKLSDVNFAFNEIADLSLDWFDRETRGGIELLDLRNNQIGKLEHNSFGEMPKLYRIFLKNNKISRIDGGAFKGLLSLQELHLRSNQIEALSPELFLENRNLRILDLSNNQLNSVDSSFLHPLFKLEFLDLGENGWTEIRSNYFDFANSLEGLDIGGPELQKIEDSSFAKLTKLKHLGLNGSPLRKTKRSAFKGLQFEIGDSLPSNFDLNDSDENIWD